MEYYETRTGRPIFNLQTFLRRISEVNENVYPIVPDGIFGDNTKRSVESFQLAFGLPVTGEVDSETWALVIEEHEKYIEGKKPVRGVSIIAREKIIYYGEEDDAILIIQAMLFSLSKLFSNLPAVEITGIYDEKTREAVIIAKEIFGHSGDEIDKKFINELVDLYEHAVVYKNDFYPETEKTNVNAKMREEEKREEKREEQASESLDKINEEKEDNNVIVWKFF